MSSSSSSSNKPTSKVYSMNEISKHNTKDDCWVVIHGNVYDLTLFLNEHPGGSKVILKEAGRDATAAFDPIHPKDIIDRFLPKHCYLGQVDTQSLDEANPQREAEELTKRNAAGKSGTVSEKPPLAAILNTFDFEAVARNTLKPEAWAYYSSGSDDEITLRENHAAFHRIWLKPRVMVNVKNVNVSTTLLGTKTSLPIYITACALGKLGHPEGEVVLTKGAGIRNVIQMMPTLASCSLDEMTDARLPGQTQWFQLYVNSDRRVTERLVRHAEAKGAKALVITVDAPSLGRREKDMRTKFVDDTPDVQEEHDVDRSQGAARAISTFIDPSLNWNDLTWFKSITSMPIVVKGIQSGEDAVLAAKHGVQAIIISNHGGRQLDTVRSGIEILPEAIEALENAGLRNKVQVYVDGGFRRGSDIYKAMALGADGVGLGRPFLYAMSAYGQAGVEKCIDILKDDLEMMMRLMGTTDWQEVKANKDRLLILNSLRMHVGNLPKDYLTGAVYEKMKAAMKSKL